MYNAYNGDITQIAEPLRLIAYNNEVQNAGEKVDNFDQ